ncbi:MAG: dipicolinate synthase subunit B [Clostridia bacterium]|nr:dipicolinate synthase subunit B [Clostridia bacterium]
MIGYAFCGSFCTLSQSFSAMSQLIDMGYDVQPIMSENAYSTDTRFFKAEDFQRMVYERCGRKIVNTITKAEPFGPNRLDALIISPCTGNTLAKIAMGITDTAVTMAAKAHLRCDGELLIALASNDSMSQNLKNIAALLTRKSVYFVPMKQDAPAAKPHSLVADFGMLCDSFAAMREGRQLRPLFT